MKMRMLRIKANCVREALDEARRLLGDDATVVQTRQYEVPVLFGLLKRRGVEILAAANTGEQIIPNPPVTPIPSAQPVSFTQVEREVVELRKTVEELMSGLAVTRKVEISPAVERLVRNGVPDTIAESILAGIDPENTGQVLGALANRIRCTGESRCGRGQARIALVGPTGVGKTTTAAKLAARYALAEKKRAALITLDTYRIGAVEQLSTYARILGIPLEVAMSPEDADALVAKHSDKEVIIIDTVGRSQRNKEQIGELSALLRAAGPTDVHLVLSASASSSSRSEAVASFGHLGVNHVIMTKLDECSRVGCILETAVTSLIPYSYVTYGQDVPDDISVAESERLAKLVWEGSL